ncbi:MAG: NAD-dependent deacylase [Candidatus Obscuribacterales bacterium]|jgi:NAD-dependent deacetylase|nr:NAD-dependent deacylase [Candidatus Obscuribacterales bacterium]
MSEIEKVVDILATAKSVVFLTGAGVSKESGIPTFREAQTGLWENYNPEELATPQAFQRNPVLVWQWYDHRRRKLDEVTPNPGHYAIAELEQVVPKVVVLTQNVDGLHRISGSTDVVELHGNIREFYCFDKRHPAKDVPKGLKEPPHCDCGSLLRPAVVWFNESLPVDALSRAQKEIENCQLLFVVGTSSLVHPAAGLPLIALQKNIPVVEINPDDTPLSRMVSFMLRGPSGKIMPKIVDAFRKIRSDK